MMKNPKKYRILHKPTGLFVSNVLLDATGCIGTVVDFKTEWLVAILNKCNYYEIVVEEYSHNIYLGLSDIDNNGIDESEEPMRLINHEEFGVVETSE